MSATSYKSQRLIKCGGCDRLTGCILIGSRLDCQNCDPQQHNECITKMNSGNSFTEGKCDCCQRSYLKSIPRSVVVQL